MVLGMVQDPMQFDSLNRSSFSEDEDTAKKARVVNGEIENDGQAEVFSESHRPEHRPEALALARDTLYQNMQY